MKANFLDLVNQIEELRKKSHSVCTPGFWQSNFVIYDVPEFISWKQKVLLELQLMKKDNEFIQNTIEIIGGFGGYTDEESFNELAGALSAIADNINEFYEEDKSMEEINTKKLIFISHSSKDKEYILEFVSLLEVMGFHSDDIVCSSIPPYCIPLDRNVYKWLVEKFQNYELHVIYMLSKNYYDSAACLNEMGAAWAMKQNWSAILLPGYEFGEISGCIDPNQISIKLDDDDDRTLKFRLEELKNQLTKEFNTPTMNPAIWERHRDQFLCRIREIKKSQDAMNQKNMMSEPQSEVLSKKKLSNTATILLIYAADDSFGQIISADYLNGRYIQTNGFDFIKEHTPREVAQWDSAIGELLGLRFIKESGNNIYTVTAEGFKEADRLKKELAVDTKNNFEEYLY